MSRLWFVKCGELVYGLKIRGPPEHSTRWFRPTSQHSEVMVTYGFSDTSNLTRQGTMVC